MSRKHARLFTILLSSTLLYILGMIPSYLSTEQTIMLYPPQTYSIKTITVSSTATKKLVLCKGSTRRLKLSGSQKKITWSTTNKKIVTVTKKGLITAKKKGSANVIAKRNGKKYKFKITVEAPSLSTKKLLLLSGESHSLLLKNTKQSVTWKSTAPSVATVSPQGKVTALANGTSKITATVNQKTYTCNVTVETPSISSQRVLLLSNEQYQLTINDTIQKATWKSTTPTIATISSEGKIKALTSGTTTVTATINEQHYTCTVVVETPSFHITNKTLTKGNSDCFNVTGTTQTISWSSSDETIVSVDETGHVYAKSVGTAIITAKINNSTFPFTMTVVVPLQSITLNQTKALLLPEETLPLTVSYLPVDTTDDKTITWTSSNKQVALVSDGMVRALSTGTATITAQCQSAAVACVITVESPSLNQTKLTLEKNKSTILQLNGTTETVTWCSDNTSIATVDSNGYVVAKKVGTTHIDAIAHNKTYTCNITVTSPLEDISFSTESISLNIGESQVLLLQYVPSDTTADKTVTFSSSDSSIATISNNYVKAVGTGQATIKATCGTKTATCTVIVTIEYGTFTFTKSNLPTYVDLRLNRDLPPIINQGQLGSCVSEAVAYMQMTNAVSKYLRYNKIDTAWNPSTNPENRFSSKWTYNFGSSSVSAVHNLLCEQGVPLLTESCFAMINGAYRYKDNNNYLTQSTSWNVTKSTMLSALRTRLKTYEVINLGDNCANQLTTLEEGRTILQKLKLSLANGNVITFSTFSNLVYGTVLQDSHIAAAGERIIVRATKSSSNVGHHLAIVGYDDTVQATCNGKTMQGAFLIANSYGVNSGNNGYIWLMYDAINKVSEFAELNKLNTYTGYMRLIQTTMQMDNNTPDWKFITEGNTTLEGSSYETYYIKDPITNKYLTYHTNDTTISLENDKSQNALWCIVPYNTLRTWSSVSANSYDVVYTNSYWLCAINKPKNEKENHNYFLDAGISSTNVGRSVGVATLNYGKYPEAKSWNLGTVTKGNFSSPLEIPAYTFDEKTVAQRTYAAPSFYLIDWKTDIIKELPELMVSFDITAASRLSFEIKLTRTDKNGTTATYTPVLAAQIKKGAADNKFALVDDNFNFNGLPSLTNGAATGCFIFSYDNLLKDISGSISDYTWGLQAKCASGYTVTIQNIILLDKNEKIVAKNTNTMTLSTSFCNWSSALSTK